MPENISTAKFSVDISDLKKNIQEANRQIKLTNAEFKAASAGMGNWAKSADGLSAKVNQLQKNLKSQKTILAEYKKQLELIEKQYGKDSKEADEMRIKIHNQEAVVKNTEAALGKYEKQLEEVEKETKKASTAYAELEKKIKEQEKTLEEAKKEYANIVLEQGKSSKAAKDLAKEIEGLSKELIEDKKAFDEAGEAADKLAGDLDDTGKNARDAGDSAKKAGDGFTVMKGILADLASTAIKACIDGLKNLASVAADAWKEFDEGADTIIKLTGATGELGDSLMDSYKKLSHDVLASSTDIGNAIGEVNTRWGLTGDQLEDVSEKYLKFSEITDSDVIGSIGDSQKALSAYGKGIESIDGFLDSLAATSQATGVNTGTLTSGIISNATAFQEMGLSLEQAVAFMGQLEKSGSNSETVLNGMRKALKNSTKDGKSMNQALLDLQKQIESNGDSTKGLQAAYDLFGKSGDQIYGAIKNGTLSFRDLTSILDTTAGTVDRTYEATMDATDRVKLQIQGLKTDVAEIVDELLQEYGPDIEELINTVADEIRENLPEIKQWIEELLPQIREFIPTLQELIPQVVDFFKKIVEHGDEVIDTVKKIAGLLIALKVGEIIRNTITTITELAPKVQELWKAISGGKSVMTILTGISSTALIVTGVVIALAAAFATLWATNEDFQNGIMEIWDGIKQKVGDAAGEILEAINSLGFDFENLGEALKTFWLWICDVLAPGFEALFKTLAQLLSGALDVVVGVIKTVVGLINGFKDGDWTMFLEGLEKLFLGFIELITAPFTMMFETFDATLQAFGTSWDEIWTGIKDFASEVWEDIKEAWGDAIEWFGDLFEGVSKKIDEIMQGIVAIVKVPINTIIRFINKFIDGLNSIKVPDWVPEYGGTSISIPKIKELEKGGVLKRGQMGLLEGNGAEAVVPLDQNRKWIHAVTVDLQKQLESEGLTGTGGHTVKKGDTIYNFYQTNNSPKSLNRLEIYRQTRNQLAMVNGGV